MLAISSRSNREPFKTQDEAATNELEALYSYFQKVELCRGSAESIIAIAISPSQTMPVLQPARIIRAVWTASVKVARRRLTRPHHQYPPRPMAFAKPPTDERRAVALMDGSEATATIWAYLRPGPCRALSNVCCLAPPTHPDAPFLPSHLYRPPSFVSLPTTAHHVPRQPTTQTPPIPPARNVTQIRR
uniref:Uncharacterized protein n=1 Tax=Mycena chlorophos TaxID=658473 RepID=A0ABQ0L3K5_MYCCL|nr:predicted protein [Mycena chlorophos]